MENERHIIQHFIDKCVDMNKDNMWLYESMEIYLSHEKAKRLKFSPTKHNNRRIEMENEIDYEARLIILEQRVAAMLCKNRDSETPMTPNELLREWDNIRS